MVDSPHELIFQYRRFVDREQERAADTPLLPDARRPILQKFVGVRAEGVLSITGFIDRTGTVVIAPQFEAVSIFRGGMAGIASGRKIGYVNGAGEVVVPPSLEYGSEFTNGAALVSDSMGYKIIDSSGRMLCRPVEK